MNGQASELPRRYDAATVEAGRYASWENSGVFHEDPDPARPPFVISMPPLNITGRAHIGHGSTYTPMDVLTRYHRMLGDNADWIPGQDHAAIATETVLIRELKREGTSREQLGREAYLERAWRWREEYGGIINEQFRALGFGPDWSRERFTMDERLSGIVTKVFVALYRDGLIYRGTRLINWDPVSQSTVSDAEVEDEERDGFLWRIRYPAEDGTFAIDVVTTRPETMLGDTAVAVHPEDERHAHLIGKTVVLPLVGRSIPIVADRAVERDFGTGAVKVTPAHDPLDNEIGERHNLDALTVIGFDARMTEAAGAPYAGLDRFAARERVVADLEAAGALVSVEPYRHRVPVSARSGAIVEPLLSLQWFCKMDTLAKPALDAYRDGRIRFVPERFGRTYESWLENIRDWNVSRQIWWGHRLPVWYTPDDQPVVAETEEEARAIALRDFHATELRRDDDTLDTWFSSALWPFSILGWPDKTPELEHWYPNQVLITSRDIIFLWVARMVMLGLRFVGEIPFHHVFITPLVFDLQGRKMSKSLGNAIDPMELVEKYGADALRFGIMRQMRLESQELRFDERFAEKARDFNTKMWNALRYVRGLQEGLPEAGTLPKQDALSIADRWVLSRLRDTIVRVTKAYDDYEFGVAADALIDFIWYEYCDWYIEATKLATPTRAAVLSYVLNAAVRLLHPIAPFVTEEIWQALPHDGATIVTASWPDPAEIVADPQATAIYEAIVRAVGRARDARTDLNLPPRDKLTLEVPADLPAGVRDLLAVHANATLVDVAPSGTDDVVAATGAVTVQAPTAILRDRYTREQTRLREEVERLERKLANENFVAKAKPGVVDQQRAKLDGYRAELERTGARLSALG